MNKIVWIGHYIEEPDKLLFNDVRFKSDRVKKIFVNINKYMPPYVFVNFKSEKKGIEFYGILCPLMPSELASSGKNKQADIMKRVIGLANRLKATQIGIAALFASIWEDGSEMRDLTDTPITTGKNTIAALVMDYISRGVNIIGRDINALNVGIVGYKNRISKIFYKKYAPVAKAILVDHEDEFLGDASNTKKATYEEIFKQSDIIIVTTMGMGLSEYISMMKPGTIVCDIVVPYYLTKEIRKQRDDIFAFEGVWSRYKALDEFSGNNFKRMFPNNIVPACVAEPIILAQENRFGCFSLGDNINYENAMAMTSLVGRNGFEFFGFKQGPKIYSHEDIEKIKSLAIRSEKIHAA